MKSLTKNRLSIFICIVMLLALLVTTVGAQTSGEIDFGFGPNYRPCANIISQSPLVASVDTAGAGDNLFTLHDGCQLLVDQPLTVSLTQYIDPQTVIVNVLENRSDVIIEFRDSGTNSLVGTWQAGTYTASTGGDANTLVLTTTSIGATQGIIRTLTVPETPADANTLVCPTYPAPNFAGLIPVPLKAGDVVSVTSQGGIGEVSLTLHESDTAEDTVDFNCAPGTQNFTAEQDGIYVIGYNGSGNSDSFSYELNPATSLVCPAYPAPNYAGLIPVVLKAGDVVSVTSQGGVAAVSFNFNELGNVQGTASFNCDPGTQDFTAGQDGLYWLGYNGSGNPDAFSYQVNAQATAVDNSLVCPAYSAPNFAGIIPVLLKAGNVVTVASQGGVAAVSFNFNELGNAEDTASFNCDPGTQDFTAQHDGVYWLGYNGSGNPDAFSYDVDTTKVCTVPDAADAAMDLSVTNNLDETITLAWFSFECEEITYQTIEPGATAVQSTYENHEWIIRGADGTVLEQFAASPGRAEIVISQGQ